MKPYLVDYRVKEAIKLGHTVVYKGRLIPANAPFQEIQCVLPGFFLKEHRDGYVEFVGDEEAAKDHPIFKVTAVDEFVHKDGTRFENMEEFQEYSRLWEECDKAARECAMDDMVARKRGQLMEKERRQIEKRKDIAACLEPFWKGDVYTRDQVIKLIAEASTSNKQLLFPKAYEKWDFNDDSDLTKRLHFLVANMAREFGRSKTAVFCRIYRLMSLNKKSFGLP